jgi:protein TonB
MIAFSVYALAVVLAGQQLPPPETSTPQAPPHVITRPQFEALPNAQQFARFYPERARQGRVTGTAQIRCTVTAGGDLSPCEVTAEDPAGYEFGHAALQIARFFKLKPQTTDGVFVTRIRFDLKP